MRVSHRIVAAAFLAFSATVPAATLPTEWGVVATTVHADCTLLFCDAASFGALLNPIVAGPHTGGLNQTFASQINVVQEHDTILEGTINMGLASAEVSIDNASVNVPILRARASSTSSNGWVGGLAVGVQGFEYTGLGATTINLDATLTGMINNPNASNTTGLSAGIWLFRDDPSIMFPAPVPATFGEFLGQMLLSLPEEDSWLAESTTTGAVNLSTVLDANPLSILLNPGDQFYLLAGLSASATGVGGLADSFSTLTLSFDSTELIPSGVSVPLPASLWLLGGALGLLSIRRRAHGVKSTH